VILAAALALLAGAAACDKPEGLRITGIEPKSGPYTGGDPVTITGTGFSTAGQPGVEVWFGDKKGTNIRFRGDTALVVDPPAGEIGQTVDVLVRFDDARSKTIEKSYTYKDPAGLGVDHLSNEPK
jgi:hypothetical protein